MKLKEHIRNHRFNIMFARSHPQTRISEQQRLLHLTERQMQLAERAETRDFQRGILHEREVDALENIAVILREITR